MVDGEISTQLTAFDLVHDLVMLEVLVDGHVEVEVSQCVGQVFAVDVGASPGKRIHKAEF